MGSAVLPTMFTGRLGVDVNIGCVGGTILSDGMIKRDDGWESRRIGGWNEWPKVDSIPSCQSSTAIHFDPVLSVR